jgi:hypothetical protein
MDISPEKLNAPKAMRIEQLEENLLAEFYK